MEDKRTGWKKKTVNKGDRDVTVKDNYQKKPNPEEAWNCWIEETARETGLNEFSQQ